jgi:hypothetical protein
MFPTIRRVDTGLSRGFRTLIVSLGLDDPYVLASAVPILGATALALTLWRFGDVITAFWYPGNDLLPEQVAVLRTASTDGVWYLQSLYLLSLALAVSVTYVFKIRRRAGVTDRPGWPMMGLVVLAVDILFMAIPCRILFDSKFERIRFNGNQCFVIGENRVELLLHCPTIPPARNLRVNRDNPALTDRSISASIMTFLATDGLSTLLQRYKTVSDGGLDASALRLNGLSAVTDIVTRIRYCQSAVGAEPVFEIVFR